MDDPVEGVFCELIDDNIFEWRIWFEGPGGSPYEGGIFEARMSFPTDYPMTPPALRILSEFWHPNVYKDGKVCISILHPPGNDPMSGELPEERWMCTQTVGTIMLSFQSMLSDPNISSAAHIEASVQWRDDRKAFLQKTKNIVERVNKRVPKHVKIPHPDTDPEEKAKRLDKIKRLNEASIMSLHDDEEQDSDGYLSGGDGTDEEFSSQESDVDEDLPATDCPLCHVEMVKEKRVLKCPSCPTLMKSGKILCGKKCYIMDCGEILPTGVCDHEISASNGWKCPKNIHKEDPNAEDNFLATL